MPDSSSRTQRCRSIIYRAAWVWPGDQPPIADGAVEVVEDRIVSVSRFDRSAVARQHQQVVDLERVVLIPALVNAHTHLEFSDLNEPLGQPGIPFTDWIRLIIQHRQNSSQPGQPANAIAAGLREAHSTGTGTLGEIATWPVNPTHYQVDRLAMAVTLFLEQLGNPAPRADQQPSETMQQRRRELRTVLESAADPQISWGASPHAPYSVGRELFQQMVTMVQAHQPPLPVAMHLAETRQERELLDHGRGDFVDLLQDLGVWRSRSSLAADSILDILQQLALLPRTLIVHGNYLNAAERSFIAAHGKKMAVVFCPRTHRFFGHDRYPLPEMLAAGIEVAVGTDSRGSSPDLNLFAELQQIHQDYPALPPGEILSLGTSSGARALGRSGECGTLTAGKRSRLSVIAIPDEAAWRSSQIQDWLLAPENQCYPVALPADGSVS